MPEITTSSADPVAEYRVVFHVTASSFEEAEVWRKRAIAILDENKSYLQDDPNSDIGAVCSGHNEGVVTNEF